VRRSHAREPVFKRHGQLFEKGPLLLRGKPKIGITGYIGHAHAVFDLAVQDEKIDPARGTAEPEGKRPPFVV